MFCEFDPLPLFSSFHPILIFDIVILYGYYEKKMFEIDMTI